MKTLCFEIETQTEFATHIKGDTLFSYMCCQLADLFGQDRLNDLLKDYKNDKPFLIVSDFFPVGYFQRPTIPTEFFGNIPSVQERKQFKQKKWIKTEALLFSIDEWCDHLSNLKYQTNQMRLHNAINPQTGLVDGNEFAPYTVKTIKYEMNSQIYMLYDENLISESVIELALKQIGLFGIGKGATRGLGKFNVFNKKEITFPKTKTNYYMTLSPCIPHKDKLNPSQSYYKLFTRFGKQSYQDEHSFPFKNPVLMADTGAVFCILEEEKQYIGCGISDVAKDKKVVCQGYAPIVPLLWEK